MKTTQCILASASLLLAGVVAAQAQSETTTTTTTTTEMTPVPAHAADEFDARAGDMEFTLGGAGSSDQDLDNSSGGVNASLGYYLTESLEALVRQSGSYTNGSGSDADFDGSTFAAIDYHFGTERLRPFVGVNAGRLYGDTTNNTFAAGIEGGLKFYVQAKTFLFALANYAWTFERAGDADENFDEGAFLWTVGVGFRF